MKHIRILVGALVSLALTAAVPTAADPIVRDRKVQWIFLTATPPEARNALGAPALVANFGTDFEALQYRIDNEDHDDVSHSVVFRRSSSLLVSVSRSYNEERNVDEFFPPKYSVTYANPDPNGKYSILLRRLPNGWVLMAMGVSAPGQPTRQLVLMRETEMRWFYPWIANALNSY